MRDCEENGVCHNDATAVPSGTRAQAGRRTRFHLCTAPIPERARKCVMTSRGNDLRLHAAEEENAVILEALFLVPDDLCWSRSARLGTPHRGKSMLFVAPEAASDDLVQQERKQTSGVRRDLGPLNGRSHTRSEGRRGAPRAFCRSFFAPSFFPASPTSMYAEMSCSRGGSLHLLRVSVQPDKRDEEAKGRQRVRCVGAAGRCAASHLCSFC